MWSVAAVGLAAGFGLYSLTIIAAILIVLTLWVCNYVGDAFPRRRYRTVKLRGKWTEDCVSDAGALFEGTDVDVIETSFERFDSQLDQVDITLRLVFSDKRKYDAVERRLRGPGEYQLVVAQAT
jgi:uncharacterized membrane protein YhiD involved in acid resistance